MYQRKFKNNDFSICISYPVFGIGFEIAKVDYGREIRLDIHLIFVTIHFYLDTKEIRKWERRDDE